MERRGSSRCARAGSNGSRVDGRRAHPTCPARLVEEKETVTVLGTTGMPSPKPRSPPRLALRDELEEALDSSDATVVTGARIVEVHNAAIHKGLIVDQVRGEHRDARLVVVGDEHD